MGGGVPAIAVAAHRQHICAVYVLLWTRVYGIYVYRRTCIYVCIHM